MAHYAFYANRVSEVIVKNFKQIRLIFAISVADNPVWLSWSVFAERKFDDALRAFINTEKVDDHNIIAFNIPNIPPTLFDFNPQINVNDFADTIAAETNSVAPLPDLR